MRHEDIARATGHVLHNSLLTVKGLLLPAYSHEIRNIFSNIKICRDHLNITDDKHTISELLTDIDEQISVAVHTVLHQMDSTGSKTIRQKEVVRVPEDIAFYRKLLRTVCRRECISWVDLSGDSFPISTDSEDLLLMLGEYVAAVVLDASFIAEENRVITLQTKREAATGYLVLSGPLPPSWEGDPANGHLPLSEVLAEKTDCLISVDRQEERRDVVDIRYQFPL
jgi:hypothetical protein